MANASVALAEAQALLNDVAKTIWTDAVLLPYLQKSHRELQVLLWESGIDAIKEITAIKSVAADATDLGGDLPSNIIVPLTLKERSDSSTSDRDWIDVAETDPLPDIEPTTSIQYWAWRGEIIEFIAPTTARKIKLRYLKGLSSVTSGASPIGFIFGEMYLGPRLASIAVESVGNSTRADELRKDAGIWIPKIIASNVKGGQSVPTRRIPYRRSFRRYIISSL